MDIKTSGYEGPERRSDNFVNYKECPMYDIHIRDFNGIEKRMEGFEGLSEQRDITQEKLRNQLIMRFDKYEKQTNDSIDKLDKKIDRLSTKFDKMENNIGTKIADAINLFVGKIVKWFMIAVIGVGITFYFRPLIVSALTTFFGG